MRILRQLITLVDCSAEHVRRDAVSVAPLTKLLACALALATASTASAQIASYPWRCDYAYFGQPNVCHIELQKIPNPDYLSMISCETGSVSIAVDWSDGTSDTFGPFDMSYSIGFPDPLVVTFSHTLLNNVLGLATPIGEHFPIVVRVHATFHTAFLDWVELDHFGKCIPLETITSDKVAIGSALVVESTAPPTCALTGVIEGPPKQLKITVQASGSGLFGIRASKSINANVEVPTFFGGTTNPVMVTATKIDDSKGAQVELTVTDNFRNIITCDPIISGEVPAADAGGCSQGPAGPLSLLGLAAMGLLRRRRVR
jgi:hypothetical protein